MKPDSTSIAEAAQLIRAWVRSHHACLGPGPGTIGSIMHPARAFAALRCNRWFWAENGDRPAKRALAVVASFFTTAEAGSLEKLPLITIPAQ